MITPYSKTKEYRQAYHLKTKLKASERMRKNYENNKEKYILRSIKSRAKKLGVEFDLTVEDIQGVKVCPILGVELERGGLFTKDNSPSVDRLIPTKGYTRDNVQIISDKANRMKNNASPEELERFATWVLNTYLPLCKTLRV